MVGMSGGVDSSTTAALLKEQGHEVVGVHLRLHDTPEKDNQCDTQIKTCCGASDSLDARKVAMQLGIECYELNFKKLFYQYVIEDFKAAYKAGFTPNPCVRCNEIIKFKLLLQYALNLGFDALATGHYCINDGEFLKPGIDIKKDQSYFLWPIEKQSLPHIMFPLGNLTKTEVRRHAARFNLVTAQKRESMDICFIPDGNYRTFLKYVCKKGEIKDLSGKILGQHEGYWNFTIGQRKRLNIASQRPLYVVKIDSETNTIWVNEKPLFSSFSLINPNWFCSVSEEAKVRLRHNGALFSCTITNNIIDLKNPQWITPGQSAVFYDQENSRIIGGGFIKGISQWHI